MENVQANRAKLAALLDEEDDDDEPLDDDDYDDDDDHDDNESIVNDATERALGKESNDRVREVLTRFGADLKIEGRYALFRHTRQEREFDVSWIADIEWLQGFEGSTSCYRAYSR